MSYGVEFTAQADDDLAKLPPLVASNVLDQLERLAEDPVGLARPSRFPFLPGRMMFQFNAEVEGSWWITALFRYSEDERRIIILDLSAQQVA
jgi:hypothetical protein